MIRELIDSELDVVAGGNRGCGHGHQPHGGAPKYNFHDVTIALGNVSAGDITGGSGNITLTGGSNNSVSFA